jgi:hypothetical protein
VDREQRGQRDQAPLEARNLQEQPLPIAGGERARLLRMDQELGEQRGETAQHPIVSAVLHADAPGSVAAASPPWNGREGADGRSAPPSLRSPAHPLHAGDA